MESSISRPIWLIGFSATLLATYVALLIGSVAAGMLLYSNAAPPPGFEPKAYQRAMLIVTLLHAVMICLLASRSRLGFRGTAIMVFCLFFGVQTALTMVETLFFVFTGSLRFDTSNMPLDAGSGALTALVGALVVAFLFRRRSVTPRTAQIVERSGLRFALLTMLYPVVYWVAGMGIALQSAAVREFYGSSIANINPLSLLLFQLLRGAVWTALALVSVHALRGPRYARALLVGLAFAILMIAQLLYPNGVMPASVRAVHALELFISNTVFGVIACLIFSRATDRQPELVTRTEAF